MKQQATEAAAAEAVMVKQQQQQQGQKGKVVLNLNSADVPFLLLV